MTTRQVQQKENWRHSGSAFTVSTVFCLFRCRFCCGAVGSVSSQAGITSCELSKLEQAFLLPHGSPVVLPGRGGAGRGPHACLHLFLLAEPRSQQCRPQPFSAPISHLSRSKGEGQSPSSPLLSVKVRQGGAGGDTIVSGRLSVSGANGSRRRSSSSRGDAGGRRQPSCLPS